MKIVNTPKNIFNEIEPGTFGSPDGFFTFGSGLFRREHI
jgi:hypothetical protein